jgi:uncharacterized protein
MLYDNALLARAYLHGWQVSGEPFFRRVCEETLGFMVRELRQEEGGFASALDADSEGVEGKYYVWTLDEVRSALGELADVAIEHFGMTEGGNFEGANIPVRATPDPESLPEIKCKLYGAREQRVRPGLDDKRLTSWNALMISALADAATQLRELPEADAEQLLGAARRCAKFILGEMRDQDGHLLRSFNEGRARIGAYLEDHAFLLEALIVLFEADCDAVWLDAARELADQVIARFADPERGGFYSTASDHEPLIARRKDLEDTPIPSGSSSAAAGLLRLSQLTGEREYERHAVSVLRLLHEIAPQHPNAFGHLLTALHTYLSPARPIACEVPPRAPVGVAPGAAETGPSPSS